MVCLTRSSNQRGRSNDQIHAGIIIMIALQSPSSSAKPQRPGSQGPPLALGWGPVARRSNSKTHNASKECFV